MPELFWCLEIIADGSMEFMKDRENRVDIEGAEF
jgi:hypothetical protein